MSRLAAGRVTLLRLNRSTLTMLRSGTEPPCTTC